jgi:aminopeptidase N
MLLLNPNSSASPPEPLGNAGRLAQAQLIVFVVQHEILHQWFGDTVTMRDWVQEYLNEGFARLMQVSHGAAGSHFF